MAHVNLFVRLASFRDDLAALSIPRTHAAGTTLPQSLYSEAGDPSGCFKYSWGGKVMAASAVFCSSSFSSFAFSLPALPPSLAS